MRRELNASRARDDAGRVGVSARFIPSGRARARRSTAMTRATTVVSLDVRGYAADGSTHVLAHVVQYAHESDGRGGARVELTPSDGRTTFTRYVCALTPETFANMREKQSLTLSSPMECGDVREGAEKGDDGIPETTLAVLACEHGEERLEIVEDGGHRLVSVLEMPFEAMDERELRERVSEEFGAMRAGSTAASASARCSARRRGPVAVAVTNKGTNERTFDRDRRVCALTSG